MDIKELREMRADKMELARAIQMKVDFGPQDQTAFDNLVAEARNIDNRIKAVMRMDGLSDPVDALAVANSANNFDGHITITNQPKVYKNLGEQMLDVMLMTTDGTGAPRARERYTQVVNAASGGSTGIGSDGGYLVETDKAADIVTSSIETGVFSSRCSQQPIGANADSFSYLAADDRNRSDSKINGVAVYRKGEADEMANSGKAKLRERELRLEDLYGLVYVTNRMLRDAPAMASYTKRVLREQLSFRLDSEIWSGNGAGQCLGVMSSDLPVTVAPEAAQGATIKAENISKMMARFRGNIRRAAWFVNQDCLSQFPLMTVGNQPVYQPDFAASPFGGLFRLPIVPVEHCKTLGALGDIVLADWSQYLLITKGGVEEAESIHVKFLTDETAFRFIMRNNGQPLHDQPITPLNGSNTLSPFVNLAARA